MATVGLTEDEIAQRGQALYDERVRDAVDEAANKGKMLFLNVETGEWEMDADDVAAAKRAKARFGDAPLFSLRIGHPTAYHLRQRVLLDGVTIGDRM